MIVVRECFDVMEARVIVSYLRAGGVDAQLIDGEMRRQLPVAGPAKIAVPDAQERRALALLEEADAGEAAVDEAAYYRPNDEGNAP
ncbi:MAG: DUF2007 domain-containing protein [Pseudomonadota bacterium]